MTPHEVAAMLRIWAADYGPNKFEVGEDTQRLWAHGCREVDSVVGRLAAESVLRTEEWPPTLAKFLDVCSNIARGRPAAPSNELEAGPCDCDHGWVRGRPAEQRYKPDGTVKVEQVPTMRPCEKCNRPGFEAWEKRAAVKRRTTTAPEKRTYPANPREGLAHARGALTEVLDRLEAEVEATPMSVDTEPAAKASTFDARDRMLSYDEAYPEEEL